MQSTLETGGGAASSSPGSAGSIPKTRRAAAPTLLGAVRSGDAGGVTAATHALKSMSYRIGAKAVAGAATELEALGLNGTIPDDNAADNLKALLRATLAALGNPAASAPAPAAAAQG